MAHSRLYQPAERVSSMLFRWILFFSSYFPVIIIYALLTWDKKPLSILGISVWTLAFFGFALFVLIVTLIYFQPFASRRNPQQLAVSEVQGRDPDVMSYIATYLLPFVTFSLETWQQQIAIAIFVFVIGFIYVRSNMIYINPMLILFGLHVYEVTEKDTKEHFFVLSQKRVRHGSIVNVVNLRRGVLLEKGS